jgi:hypothetical protein
VAAAVVVVATEDAGRSVVAAPSRPSAAKRQKERARQEKAKEKAEKRAQRAAERSKPRTDGDPGIDPDIADIVPGPQPLPPEFDEE